MEKYGKLLNHTNPLSLQNLKAATGEHPSSRRQVRGFSMDDQPMESL